MFSIKPEHKPFRNAGRNKMETRDGFGRSQIARRAHTRALLALFLIAVIMTLLSACQFPTADKEISRHASELESLQAKIDEEKALLEQQKESLEQARSSLNQAEASLQSLAEGGRQVEEMAERPIGRVLSGGGIAIGDLPVEETEGTKTAEEQETQSFAEETRIVSWTVPTASEATTPDIVNGQPSFKTREEQESYARYINEKIQKAEMAPFVYDPESSSFIAQTSAESAEASLPTTTLAADMSFYGEKDREQLAKILYIFLDDAASEAKNAILISDEESRVKLTDQLEAEVFSQAVKGKRDTRLDSLVALPDGRKIYFKSGDFLAQKNDAPQSRPILSLEGKQFYDLPADSPFIGWFGGFLREKLTQKDNVAVLPLKDSQADGLIFSIADNLSRDGLSMKISNNSDKTWLYSRSFGLFGFEDGQWLPLRTPSGGSCFSTDAYSVKPGWEEAFDLSWKNCAGELKRGLYLLRMPAQSQDFLSSGKTVYPQIYFFLP